MKDYVPLTAPSSRSLWIKTFLFLLITSVLLWFSVSFIFSSNNFTIIVRTDETTEEARKKATEEATKTITEEVVKEVTEETTSNLLNVEETQNNWESRTREVVNKLLNSTRPAALGTNNVKKYIAIINREEKIYNKGKFGPLQNDSLVIVVQVHRRISYLRHLITSLSKAKGISNVLLVFSHDMWDDDINALIRTIDFCKVVEIFYPYSIQLYPHEFPGDDPNDCPHELPKYEAVKRSCHNAFYPDNQGRYRLSSAIQVKHHWWWKANRVFDLTAVYGYDGLVLFLEEDLYLVEDFIPMLRVMQDAVKNSCDYCKILSLAENEDAVYLRGNYNRADKARVTSKFSNMGLTFNRATWNEMIDCRDSFCNYDDVNWDFSLQHVFTTCMKRTAAMALSAPRVFHLGTCGMHFKSKDCDPSGTVQTIKDILSNAKNKLYPSTVKLSYSIDHSQINGGYGGFGDPRDHALCLGMTVK